MTLIRHWLDVARRLLSFVAKKYNLSSSASAYRVRYSYAPLAVTIILLIAFVGATFVTFFIAAYGNEAGDPRKPFIRPDYLNKAQQFNGLSQILSENFDAAESRIVFGVPVVFGDVVVFQKGIQVEGEAVFKGNIQAPNVVYSVRGEQGITVEGDQELVITNNGVISFQGQSGDVSLEEGSGIVIDGVTITNTGVLSVQGQQGAVAFTAGEGITIDGTTISLKESASTDESTGFGTIGVTGQTSITAGNASDTITFVPGAGISLTTNPSTNEITVSALGGSAAAGWTDAGSIVYLTDASDLVGIGTSTPTNNLEVVGTTLLNGNTVITGTLDVSGSVTLSGLTNGILRATGGVLSTTAVDLASSDVTGILPVSNGGTGVASAFANGSVIFSNGTSLAQDTSGLFFDSTTNRLGVGTSTPGYSIEAAGDIKVGNGGSLMLGQSASDPVTAPDGSIFYRTSDNRFRCRENGSWKFCDTSVSGSLSGSGANGQISFFTGANTLGGSNNMFWDQTNSFLGLGTSTPNSRLEVSGNARILAQGDLELGDADSTNFVSIQAPATVTTNFTLTLPDNDGSVNQVLTTDGSGILSWQDVTGLGGGSISAVGDVTNGAAFTAAGTAGTSLWFYDADGRGQLTIANLSAARTFTLPDITGTFALLEGTQTFTGTKTFSALSTFNGGVTVETGDTFTFNGDAFTDLTGTGLQITGGALESTLGTSVNLASAEVTGTLGLGNGGTGVTTTPTNGQILIGNGTGYVLSTITGTANQINISNGLGSITLSTPQNIDSNANVNFNSVAVDTQAGITLSPYGVAAGNTGEVRFGELTANGTNYIALKAPDNIANSPGNVTLILPNSDGDANQVLITDGSGNLSWTDVNGITAGDISAIGDVTSGAAFTAAGTQGTSLYFYDPDGRGQLTIANLTAARTFTLPDISGTFALLEGTQTFSGAKTFSSLATLNGGLTMEAGDTFTFNNDAFTDLTGTGLTITGGALQTTLGTTVDLTTEVTGTLPIANGGTGVTSTPTNGQLLIGNGSGYTLATITGTSNQISVTNGSGTITLATPQNIDTNANVNFNSVTTDTQGAVTLNPYGVGAGSTGEVRFGELTANGTNFVAIKGPDNVPNSPGNITFTLPNNDGNNNEVLVTDGSGNLSWQSVSGVGAGDISAIGDVTSGDAFTAAGTQGTALWFYDADGRGQLTVANLTAPRTFTLPDITGTFALLEGTQTFSGAKTFTALATFNGGVTIETGDTFTFNGDAFTDLTGTGLTISGGALQTTLGTSVDLTTEITGTLPIGNGGTGLASTPTNGQLLIGNGSGYTLATLSDGTGITISEGSGTITVTNSGVTSISGTANQVSASASTGAVTLSLPQNIDSNATVAFNSVTLDSQGAIVLNPYGGSAGNTGEVRFGELVANGSNYVAIKAPDNVPDAPGNVTFTLPADDGDANFVMTTDGNGNLSWQSVSGVGAGDISAIGDVTSGDAFTAAGTQGTSLWFYDTDGRGRLTIADLTAARTFTLPDITGTFALLEGTQTFSGAKTFSSLATFNGDVTLEAGDTLTFNNDAFTDLTGTGLTISGGALQTTLGTSVDLTTEVTGTLPIGNGGTGLAATPTNGQLLIGNGSGYTLATITGTSNQVSVSNGSGSITLSTPQNIDANASVAFNTVTVDSQTGIVLNPYGGSSGEGSELRFVEVTGSGSNYVGFRAPDSADSNDIYTLPSDFPASNGYVLTSTTTGGLAWTDVNGVVSGDITSIGDVTNGDAFTASGTQGTALWFYDADGRGQLTIANLTAPRTFTLPDITGTFALLEGTQTFSGAKTFSSLATFNGDITLEAGDTLTFNNDAFTDLTGTGLTISGGSLQTTLGTTVDLTTEVAGTLPIANGGTGVTGTPSNGQLLIGNGSGYTLATITGTSNQISVTNGSGSITLATPQNIDANATVSFNSVTTDTQAGLTLSPYGSSAGNTGETRFGELSANGSNYVAIKAPDNVPDAPGNITLTLPNSDGNNNEVLVTDGSGNLSWQSVSGVGAGDISAIGDVTSGDAFTAAGTQGTSLYFYDADGRGQLTIANLTAARTYTLPDITGTFAMLEGTQTFSGAKTFSSLITATGGITMEAGDTLTFNNDAFTDLTGTGLTISGGALQTTLGTTVDLTTEVTGTLPIANGGTGLTSTPTNGQLLIGNGSGYSLATITGTTNQISVSNGSGSITLSTPQNIDTDAAVNFNSVTLDTQGAITLAPYNTAAGNTSEIRFRELATNGSEYVGFKAPDDVGSSSSIYTLPSSFPAGNNYVLASSTTGTLSWAEVSSLVSGDITAIGDVTSGDAFTAAGTQGTSLWFYDPDGRGQLTIDNLTATRTYTLPDITGTFAMLEGTQTFTGTKTFSSNTTFSSTITTADNQWIGLGSGAGRIEFDDQTTDEVNILNARLGIGTSAPNYTLDVAGDVKVGDGSNLILGSASSDPGSAPDGSLYYRTSDNRFRCRENGTWKFCDTSTSGSLSGNGSSGQVAFYNGTSTLTGSNNFFWDDAQGRLGLGTSTPGSQLEVTGLATFNGGVTLQAGDTLTFNGDAFTDLTGTGLTISSGSLQTTLGTTVDLTTEVTGTLPIANGGTGVTGTPTNGQLLIGNGSGYTLATITGTSNQVSVSNGSGTITLSTPQNIDADAAVNFNSLTVDTQGGLTLLPYNTSAGNTGEIRFNELAANGAQYTGFKAPDDLGNTNSIYTLPGAYPASSGYLLSSDASGNLSWTTVSGAGGGQVNAVGSMSASSVFADSTADDDWLGLGASAGRIEFDLDGANTDEVTILDADLGIGTSTPTERLEVAGGNILVRDQGDLRLGDSDSSSYVAIQAPATLGGDVTLTLPDNDGDADQVLVTDGSGNLSWQDVSGVSGAGDITAVGDVTSGAAFTSSGTAGTSLWFYDADGRGQLTIDNLTAARTYTLPDITGTFAMLEGTQTFGGAKTFTSLITANGGITMEAGDTFTFNGDAFTDLTGTGLQISSGSLQTTLGTTVDLTTEVTGTLPIANGGTGVTGTPTNGQLLIGNGSGYTLATIAGTTNQVSVSNGSGTITLSTPQNIDADASVNFNSVTLDTQGAITVLPYNTGAGNTGEIRFNELAANGSSYVGFKAPDDAGSSSSVYTLPSAYPGGNNYVLASSTSGVLSWAEINSLVSGDITAIGDVTSGDAFTAAGTQGTSLWFYDADGRGQLTIDNLTAARTYSLPDITGTFAMLEGTQTFSGSKTFTSLITANGGITMEAGDTFTFNSDAFTDLTGTGLTISSGSLQTTLGTTVDLTTEVTGTLPIANGGTGVTSTPSNGQLLIGNGSGYTLATITGTSNQISVSNGSGSITLSTPQNIDSDAAVNFNSVSVDTQAGVTLSPYGSSAGNTGEVRFRELGANGSNYVAIKSPDNVPDAPGNITLTLPNSDGNNNEVLVTDGSGNLSWQTVSGVGAGDIQAIGDVTSGDAFTASGTAGTALWFYDADGRGQLTIANLTAARTFTLPDITGTFAMLEGTQSFSGAKTFTSLATFNGDVTFETGDTLTFNGDAFTDLTGTGLQISSGSLQTTLGTTVDLTTEVTGTLPIANGGTGVTGTPTNGQVLIGNGSGYTLATLTGTTNQISVANGSGSITLSTPQNIDSDAAVNFNSVSVDTQAGLTLAPYGTSAGNTGETRYRELAANGSNYVAIKSPDNVPDAPGNITLTLPNSDGNNNEVLVTDGSGNLSWQTVSGVGAGDIQAIGDVTSGDAFTSSGTAGTSLWFYDADGRGQLTIADLTAARTYTLPDITGTFALLEGTQTFSGAKTFSSLATFNGGVSLETGDTFTFNGDAFTDLTGTGLQISSGSLQTTLGTTVDLTTEVTGTLPIANGGTGVTSTPSNGQLLIGNGSGYSLATITGTSNQISVSNGSGTITLSTPQDINTDAAVNFNSLTTDTQGGVVLLPYGTSAGNTGEVRFNELAANGSNFVALRSPDNVPDAPGNITLTLPNNDGDNNQVLVTDGNGNLSFASVSGVESGDISSIGDVTSGDAFTAAGTQGTSLWFYDADGRGQLTIANLTAARTYTLPDITGTFAMLEGTQTFSGAKTFSSLATFNGGVSLETGDTFTFNGDAFTDLTGTGLQISSGSLQTTLGTTVDLTTEVTGTLPIANGGTGVTGTPTNGQLLIGNGSGYTLATITGTTNQVSVSNGSGTITLSTPQNINTDAVVNFNSLTLDAQAGLTLAPYGSSAGNTSELRFGELTANGSNYLSFKAPDNIPDAPGNLTFVWPADDGTDNYVLTTDGNGVLAWESVSGVGAGDISAIGDVTSGDAFTAAGTQGTSLWFYDADGRGQLTLADLTAARTYTLPDITGTFAMLEGTQTFSGAKTFSALATFNGGITMEAGDTFTFNSDAFTDLTGTGLQISSGSLQTTLGTSVDLTTEVTGTLPIANGGTGATTFTAGSIIYYNGTSFAENNTGLFWDETYSSLGLGTTAPARALSVVGGINVDAGDANDGDLNQALIFGDGGVTGEGISSKRTAGGNQFGLDFYTAAQPRLQITNTGAVGIGTGTIQSYSATTIARTDDPVFTIEDQGDGVGYLATDAQNFIVASEGNINMKTGVTFVDDGPIVSGTSRLFIEGSTGEIGIGVTDPGALLDVGGNVYIRDQNDIRLGDGDSSAFVALQAPATLGGDVTLTLPDNDGDSNQVLITDGNGNLSWTSVSGVEAGDISAIGDVTSGEAFTAAGTQGTSLWFYDVDGRGQLTIDNLTAARTYSLPDITGTFAMLEGTQTFSGDKTFTSLITANGGITMEAGDTFTFNSDAFTDLTGTGLTISSGSLQTTLGTTVDLTTEVTGTLPIANGGTGATSFTAGSVVFSNGSALTQDNANLFFDDSTNRLGIGLSNPTQTLEVATGVRVNRATAVGGAYFDLVSSRGSLASPTALQSTDILGTSYYNGYDGTNYEIGAMIRATVDGTTGDNLMPGRLAFFTRPASETTNGANPTERMRIDESGDVGIGITNPGVRLDVGGDMQVRNQGDVRFGDSDNTNYAAIQAPATIGTDYTLTLPDNDGTAANQVLVTDGNGVLSWASVSGVEAGDISAIGDVTSGDAFTAAGTQGTSLWFYDVDGRGQLTIDNLTAARTYTLPDITGTFAMLEGTQTFGGAKTFTSLITANGGITMEAGDTFTFNSDSFTDLTGTGLTISSGSLQTTLGTTVDLTTEVTGTLPIANGGTGVTGTPTNGQLLIGNGSGYTLATITGTSNQISVANSSGSITLSTPQDIHTDADVNFNSLTLDTQGALTLLPYNTGTGNTGEIRLRELAANGSSYVGFKAPDDAGSSNSIYTLPGAYPGGANYALVSDTNGVLSWANIPGVSGVGDITAVGSMTSGLAFGDATADDDWLGLGASAGRIEFDDQTTDEVNILGAWLGVGTTAPAALTDFLGTTEQLRLSYDVSNYSSFTVSSSGDMTIAPSGGDTSLTGNLAISGNTTLGDATGDTISFTGRVNTDIIPSADETYDLGSSSNRWQDLYLGPASLHLYSTAGETTTLRDWNVGINETDGSTDGNFRIREGSNEYLTIGTSGNLGIGTTNPSYKLQVDGTIPSGANQALVRIEGTSTDASNDQAGFSLATTFSPGSASTQTYRGLRFFAQSASGNISGGTLAGLDGGAFFSGTGTLGTAYGAQFYNTNTSTGTISNSTSLYVQNAFNIGGGTITDNYGIFVAPMTSGTNDYGARIDAAQTQTLWISGNADNTTAAAGIAFGASRDTNLYRSAANTLQTDDSFTVNGGNLLITTQGDLRLSETSGGNYFGLQAASSMDSDDIYTWPADFPAGATYALTSNATGILSWTDISGATGDITAVGSMISGLAFGDATADDDWLGLGAGAGRIEFDDQTIDEVNILGARLGLGTSTPSVLAEFVDTDTQLRLTNNGTTTTSFTTDSLGMLLIYPTGEQVEITGTVFPAAQDAYDLGDATARWGDIFSNTISLIDSTTNGGRISAGAADGMVFADTEYFSFTLNQYGTDEALTIGQIPAGTSENLLDSAITFAAMDGNDTVRNMFLNPTNANHTGTNNLFVGLGIGNITADADATEIGLDIGTGWDLSARFAGDIQISGQGDLRLADSDSSHYSGFQANGTTTTSYVLTLPAALPGTPGTYALSTDENGNMSFTSGGAGDITAVGSMTTGDTFADSSADDDWLGLGASAGRIQFNDDTSDTVAVLGGNLGIGTTNASYLLDIVGTANLFRMGYDGSNYMTGGVGSTGVVTFDAVGGSAGFFFNDALTVSNGNLYLGAASTTNGLLTFYSSGAGEAAPTIQSNSNGDLSINASTGVVNIGSGSGDIILDPGANNLLANLTGAGNFLIQDNGATFVTFDSTSLTTTFDSPNTTGNVIVANANSLTTGQALNISSTSTSLSSGRLLSADYTSTSGSTAYTGRLGNISLNKTLTSGTGQDTTGNILNLSRNFTLNNTGNAATVSGAAFSLSDSLTQTAGTLTATANTAAITRTCGSSLTCSGSIVAITGDGSGTDTTGLSIAKSSGTMTNGLVIGSGSQTITNGIVLNSTGITTDLTMQNGETIDNNTDGQIKIGDSAQLVLGAQASDPGTSTNGAMYYNTTSHKFRCRVNGAWADCGGSTTTVGSMTGTSLFADSTADDDWLGLGASAGRIEFDDQTLDEVNVLGAKLTVGTSTPSSVGQAFEVYNGATMTSSQSLAYINYDYSGTSAGDLLRLNIGSSTNIGNFLNIMDNGTSLFSVSETSFTTSLPTSFTAAGDVSISYDMLFTNQTSSYIKSNAPLYIEAGESFENNDLTLKTYGTGQVIFDTPTGMEVYANIASGYAGYFFNDGNATNRNGLLVQAGLDTSPGVGTDGTLIQFYDGDGTDVGEITYDGTTTTYGTTSDARVKNNIVQSSRGLADLMQIQVRDYRFTNDPNGGVVTGFIAQELYQIYPQAVQAYFDEPEKLWGVDYGKITPLLVRGIQEQQAMIDAVFVKNTAQDVAVAEVDVENEELQVFKTAAEIKMERMEQDIATMAAALKTINSGTTAITNVASIEAGLAALDVRTTALETKTTDLEAQVASLSAKLADAVLGTATASGSGALASSSAALDELIVSGDTNLNNLSVTGTINAGLLTIEGFDALGEAAINTLGGNLKLQALGTAGIEMVGGKVTIDTDGNIIVVGSIEAEKVKINTTNTSSASLGTGSIEAGQTQVIINTTAVTPGSAIFVTAQSRTTAPLFVTNQIDNDSFTVKLATPQATDVEFKWWIVDETTAP